MNINTFISKPITLKNPTSYNTLPCDTAFELASQIEQAALNVRGCELDNCVKQIGCDNKLGHKVAKATQARLAVASVTVNWIPNSHDFFGSLLFLNGQWSAAFSSAPSVAPEGMSLTVNDLAVKRGDVDDLFTVTASSANKALHAIFEEWLNESEQSSTSPLSALR